MGVLKIDFDQNKVESGTTIIISQEGVWLEVDEWQRLTDSLQHIFGRCRWCKYKGRHLGNRRHTAEIVHLPLTRAWRDMVDDIVISVEMFGFDLDVVDNGLEKLIDTHVKKIG